MNPDRILFWFPIAACALAILNSIISRVPLPYAAWRAVAAIFILALCGHALAPGAAPWISSGAFVLLLVLPSILQHRVNAAMRQNAFPRAAWLARLKWTLAPHMRDGGAAQRRLLAALTLATQGRMQEADMALESLRRDPLAASVRLAATGQLCRLRGNWSLLPPGLGDPPDSDAVSIAVRLRVLHETGDRAAMIRLLARQRGRLAGAHGLAALTVMAACGRVAAVERLLAGPMSVLVPASRSYWRAAAALAAGDPCARITLERLTDGPNRLVALTARQRLDAPPPPALTPDDTVLLTLEEALLPDQPPAKLRQAPVTLALTTLNLLAYAAEVLAGGATDMDVLYRLGGLWPDAVLLDQGWWRLAAALFLHLGPLHLGLNMLALLVLGMRVEVLTGPLATLTVYAAAGLASTGGVLLLMAEGFSAPDGLVGASGAIMGLVGALLVNGVRGRLERRGAAALLVATVVLQVAFDLATPEVSMAGHLFGLAGGAAAALAWRVGPPVPGQALLHARRMTLGILAVGAAALVLLVWRYGG